MRLEQLEYLLMISKSASLTEASERLFITQQSLGKAIRDLEDELGVALLLRNNRGSVLTKEGYETLEQAKEILEKVHALQNYFEKEDEILRGKLIILCSQVMFSDELPLALESFARQYQEVEVTAMEKDSYYMPILQKHLLETEDAVVISILHMPQEKSIGMDRISDTLQFHPIYKARWMACMNSRNYLAKQKQIPVETLLKEKILISSPDYPEMGLDYALLTSYGKANVKRRVSNLEIFYSVLEETTDCVGIVPDVLLRHKRASVPEGLVCREIEPRISTTIGYLIDKNQSKTTIARKFIQYLEAAVEKKRN